MSFSASANLDRFLSAVVSTPGGLTFLVVGSAIGLALALVLFATTVFAMPMLLDNEIDFVTAVITSIKGVLASPVTMLGWGVLVTVATILALAPVFLGLLVVLPVLGHATWHLYQIAVIPEA
jgi:uncharacterized membrane protein